MPRKAPKEVIEHRVTFGNFERDLIVKELAASKENKLYTAGINQVGQIAGSGVLLWGLAAYFGYNLVSEATDKINWFIDKSSTGLADMWMMGFGGLTSKEAAFISRNYALLNERIRELNAKEAVKEEQLRAIQMGLMNGTITFQEQLMMLEELGDVPSAETIAERESIVEAKARLARMKDEFGEGAFNDIIDGWPTPNKDALANLILSY